MNITTKKLGDSRYIIVIDGKMTRLRLQKGDAPKFGLRQQWEVRELIPDAGEKSGLRHIFLFEAPGKAICIAVLERILAAANNIPYTE